MRLPDRAIADLSVGEVAGNIGLVLIAPVGGSGKSFP